MNPLFYLHIYHKGQFTIKILKIQMNNKNIHNLFKRALEREIHSSSVFKSSKLLQNENRGFSRAGIPSLDENEFKGDCKRQI